MRFFWHWLLWPWSLFLCCGALLFLLIGAFWLPQLPGQFNDDSVAATRWLLSTSAEYGWIGNLLLSLGLFNVIQGSLLRLFLALLGLILSIHIADLIGSLLWFRRLPTYLEAEQRQIEGANGKQPLMLSAHHGIHRNRSIATVLPDALYERVQSHLVSCFDHTLQYDQATLREKPEEATHNEPSISGEIDRWLLSIRSINLLYFRLLFVLGLAMAVVVLWFTITVGWTLSPSSLSPGETFRYPPRDLELRYQVMDETGQLTTPAQLQVRIGQERQSTAVAQASRTRLGTVDVQIEPGPPGVLIQSNSSEAILAVPGQQGRSSSIGLIFPVSGSEESIVLPEEQVGIRIVRLATTESASSNFMVEIFQGNENQPVERMRLLRDQVQPIPIENSENPDLTVLLIPSPGLDVRVRYMPGSWLLWVALALILVGAIRFGFGQRPTFVFVQIGAWPKERSVVIVQSNQNEQVNQIAHLGQSEK